jgi:superfamily II DNA or RNA helicase
MKHITRDRPLTSEEADKYDRVREQIALELPELIARHHERMAAKESVPAPRAVAIPGVSVTIPPNPRAGEADELGMRPMQAKVWLHRGEQYLLIKSPPASGKSRALMFVALHKLKEKEVKQVIIAVPENSIGASFNDEPLSKSGFFADWHVEAKWNLSNAPGGVNGSKVDAVGRFLASDDKVLVCAHATFRFAVEKYGVEAFDDRLIAVDEFHHVAASEENRLGEFVRALIARGKTHIVAMTGSYFRGDAGAVLDTFDEGKFKSVTFTYYEQLNGYRYLKTLDIGYYLYTGAYNEKREEKASIFDVLNPGEKTIVHIPNVNSRESTGDKLDELNKILSGLGVWQETDQETGFDLVKTPGGRTLRIADLVDDAPDRAVKRGKVLQALKDPAQKHNRDHVDMIIALGMAKEGFDWIWCEHALTVGYRSSLTEIVQIIGRATRDAPGKTRARFTNLIAEPDASESAVTEAVNDTLKAIAASLLMEQVLAPRMDFKLKSAGNGPTPGLDYGPGGYKPGETNVGVDPSTGGIQVEIKGLVEPKSVEAQRIVKEDLLELVTAFVQDTKTVQDGMFNQEQVPPQEITQLRMGKIVKEKYPTLTEEDQEAVRQQAVAAMTLVQKGDQLRINGLATAEDEPTKNTALIDGIRKFCTDVRELSIDLIDSINPFGQAYAILSKSLDSARMKAIENVIAGKKTPIKPEEALDLAKRAHRFKADRGRPPSPTSPDPWETRMAEGAKAFLRYKNEGRYQVSPQ